MNQILSVDMPKNNRNVNKKASIKSVIIFFSIVVLVLGISMLAIGIVSNMNKDGNDNNTIIEPTETNVPQIEIIPESSKLTVTVTSENKISQVIYYWNNGEETAINAYDENEMKFEIKIPEGTNILTVKATDENGKSNSYKSEYVGTEEYEPVIELEQIGNQNTMAIKYTSEVIVKQISYYFDNEEPKTVEVNDLTGDLPITLKEGNHNFTVEVTNEDGQTYTVQKQIIAPTIKVTTDGQKFMIEAEDTSEGGITTVSINMNGQESEKKVNSKTYEDSIELKDGENRLILIVRNSENALVTRRIRFVKN